MRRVAACRSGGLHAALCGALGAFVWSAQGGDRRAGARAGLSALRLSAHPGLLGRDGHATSAGRAYRLWRAAGLQVPRKRPRRRVASCRPTPQAPTGANQVWSYDFVFDRCANGQQLKCLTVTDEWTREGLAMEVDGRIRSARVIEVVAGSSASAGRHFTCAPTTSYVARSGCRPGNRSRARACAAGTPGARVRGMSEVCELNLPPE